MNRHKQSFRHVVTDNGFLTKHLFRYPHVLAMYHPVSTTSPAQTDTPLGMLLATERQRCGIPIEQAARDTRIRVQRLREIESDDFGQFPNPSYARMFLIDYAKYLGLSFQEIEPLLPDQGAFGIEGYQYLQEAPPKLDAVRAMRPLRTRRLMPVLATAAALMIGLMVTFKGYTVWRNLHRLGGAEVEQTTQTEGKVFDGGAEFIPSIGGASEKTREPVVLKTLETDVLLNDEEIQSDRAALLMGGSVVSETKVR